MQKLSLSCFILAVCFLFACQDSATKDGAETVNNDTIHTGLEGTRDQAGQLSTDAKQDTSSGQSTTGTSSGKDSSGMSTASGKDDEFLRAQVAGKL